ncbi:phosphopantetheine-binding protein [Corynebacterium cystitidis]|uniref:Aryl carrier domain-containing protein n=1 Tax=Corynebacterium cystitidis DSM 20524 TaxID=1121357 RepID=A0A1H9RFE8_9CORY|nr:phosphopantetheine-binding protein [Corynebacterium cystitidis]WJY81454.1 Isochorismatase [Corynebacterium cystitidis DSM 20524]SER71357.1 Aryl carrier domain-containing protein [Corynebacterium cystitidis DSM 20524]SNV87317.1 isochorismatase [Corynebacterium cystitidis]
MTASQPDSLTVERIRADIAAALDCSVGDLTRQVVLLDCGLDSMRLVMLVEDWRAAGFDVDFFRLSELSTLGEWEDELASLQG